MKPGYDITTKIEWKDMSLKRKLTVNVSPFDDMDIIWECDGQQDQILELDEPAWKALYEMIGEVK